jgi:signal transduction histidine kinase
MRIGLRQGVRVGGRTNPRTHAFWTCFGILCSFASAYGVVLAVILGKGDLLDLAERPALAWRVALGCWLFGLPLMWLVAHLESRWILRRVREPIARLMRQCEDIRAGRVAARVTYATGDSELAGLTCAINELLAHFNRIVLCQHQFAADAAHELRTPLTALAVVGENALASRCAGAELREAVGSMLEESKHMQRLIENLLELSRASAVGAAERDPSRECQPLELGRLARSCVEALQILAEEKQQRIELASVPVWSDADATLVRQALLNVIHNAIEHCPEGARIQVVTGRFARDCAMIRVIDDGPGIPIEQQAYVFKRFFRAGGTTRRRSLGLGLSIARAVLKSQRGDIYLRSEAGAGCCFTLILPRLAASVELAVAQAESNTAHGVNQFGEIGGVDLATQAGNVHIDDIVERGGAPDIFPDLMRQHLA